MSGTDCVQFTHKKSRSYLNHLVLQLHWRHNFYNIVFKVKPILYIAAGSAPYPPPPPNEKFGVCTCPSPLTFFLPQWFLEMVRNVWTICSSSIDYNVEACVRIHLLIYLLTPCCRVLPEKLTVSQLVKKLPEFYVTRRFIAAFTSSHTSLSWATSI